jgi:hypothetical protein
MSFITDYLRRKGFSQFTVFAVVYYFLPRRVLSLGGRWCAREDMLDVA